MPMALIVHGGAWQIPREQHAAHLAGCQAAHARGWQILSQGGSALDAVEAAIRLLEDDPTFDAGRGSVLNLAGDVELDAGLMEGGDLRAGSVVAVRTVSNPISLARAVLTQTEHVLLAGAGADAFARGIGFPTCLPTDLIVPRELANWRQHRALGLDRQAEFGLATADTVGAVALDAAGMLAAGNSTGGTSFKLPGRVGDSALPGCGYYADNTLGAAVCTGWGEHIMRTTLARVTVDLIARLGDPQAAAEAAISGLQKKLNGLAGVICLSPDGRVGRAHSTANLAHAWQAAGMSAAALGLEVGG